MITRAPGQATMWVPHMGVGRAGSGAGWYQQRRAWWAAQKAAGREARGASRNACWDATHDAFTPLGAEAAPEMAAAHAARSVATLRYGLSQ